MSPRVYERKFDWDEARRLRDEERLTFPAIAERLGVTVHAVRYAYYPKERAASIARRAAYQRTGRCQECGAQTTRIAGGVSLRCNLCSARAQAKVRDGRAYCSPCDTWKPLREFSLDERHPARGVRAECRSCETNRRREHRHKNIEQTRAYDRAYKRRKREEEKAA